MVLLRGGDRESAPSGHTTARYDIDEEESPSHALVEVLATLTGMEETEMETLYDHVDLEALESFLESTADTPYWSGSVQLEMDGSVLFVDRQTVVVMADPVAEE